MKRLFKVAIVIIVAFVLLLIAGVLFGGQNFCIGNTTLCFSSE